MKNVKKVIKYKKRKIYTKGTPHARRSNAKSVQQELLEKMKEENPFRKLSDIVYKMAEDAIISCNLRPGTQLNTVKISSLLDISRTQPDDSG